MKDFGNRKSGIVERVVLVILGFTVCVVAVRLIDLVVVNSPVLNVTSVMFVIESVIEIILFVASLTFCTAILSVGCALVYTAIKNDGSITHKNR